MLIFIDDYSWISWLYLLQAKLYAFDSFVKFKELMEKYFDYHIKKFQIDHGGEFTSNEFKELYKKYGIK